MALVLAATPPGSTSLASSYTARDFWVRLLTRSSKMMAMRSPSPRNFDAVSRRVDPHRILHPPAPVPIQQAYQALRRLPRHDGAAVDEAGIYFHQCGAGFDLFVGILGGHDPSDADDRYPAAGGPVQDGHRAGGELPERPPAETARFAGNRAPQPLAANGGVGGDQAVGPAPHRVPDRLQLFPRHVGRHLHEQGLLAERAVARGDRVEQRHHVLAG